MNARGNPEEDAGEGKKTERGLGLGGRAPENSEEKPPRRWNRRVWEVTTRTEVGGSGNVLERGKAQAPTCKP